MILESPITKEKGTHLFRKQSFYAFQRTASSNLLYPWLQEQASSKDSKVGREDDYTKLHKG